MHQMHFFETILNIDSTPFLNYKLMLNYNLNLLSKIDYKCLVLNKSHIDKGKIYLLLKK